MSRASAGDTLVFPRGEYLFTETVVIDRSITLVGAAKLVDVSVVEPGEPNDPPYWDSPPSVCYTADSDLDLFHVASDAVAFKSFKLVGAITHEAGTGDGIVVVGHDQLEIDNCEITRFRKGIDFRNSRGGVVTGSYLHENYRNGFGYGISITGTTMATGGFRGRDSAQRIHLQPPFHCLQQPADSVHRGKQLLPRQRPGAVAGPASIPIPKAGTRFAPWSATTSLSAPGPWPSRAAGLEITGNYFDPGCGDYSVGGYSRMLDFGEPTHNGNHIAEAVLHNIYIGDNVNATEPWRRLLWVDDYEYEGETKFVAYNLFVDGRLFKYNSALSSAPRHPFPDSSPSPFVGHIYVTLPDAEERVDTLATNTWYDLHALAVDPQGANDIAEIGVQLISAGRLATGDRIALEEFSARDSYFIRGASGAVYAREEEGSAAWTDRTEIEGLYVDGAETAWGTAGRDRIRFTARFRVSDQALGGRWRMFGYARDQDGNLPVALGTSCWRAGP